MDARNQYKQKKLIILGGGLSGVGAAILAKNKAIDGCLSDRGVLSEQSRK